jgi:hypothetical protein
MENEERNWLVLFDMPPDQEPTKFSAESVKLVNLAAIRHIDQVTPLHVRLNFSETHMVEIHGTAAGELVLCLMSRGITTAGLPFETLNVKSESQEPA